MAMARDHHGSDCMNLCHVVQRGGEICRTACAYSHFKHERLGLTKPRAPPHGQAFHGNDACNTGANIGNAREDDECVLHIAHTWEQGKSHEDGHGGDETDAAASTLEHCQSHHLARRHMLASWDIGILGGRDLGEDLGGWDARRWHDGRHLDARAESVHGSRSSEWCVCACKYVRKKQLESNH